MIGLCMTVMTAQAVIETYEFSDADLERRYHRLSDELRCPKCQNQTISDSNAPIAKDLRFLLHEQLESGASDDEILSFMVARYGEFVLYKPPFSPATWLIWIGPFVLLAAGLAIAVLITRRSSNTKTREITQADAQRIDEMLGK